MLMIQQQHAIEANVNKLLDLLESETTIILKWFRTNEMKSNDDKCHLFVANKDNVPLKLGNDTIDSSQTVKLLGVLIDNNLISIGMFPNFVKHEIRNCMPLFEFQNT